VVATIGGTGSGSDAQGDVIANDIENLIGSDGDDRLTGNAGNNRLEGRSGDDVLRGGAGDDWLVGQEGADNLAGGAGSDGVSYAFSIGGITATIGGTGSGGDAQGDVIANDIETIEGSLNASNNLTGNAAANNLLGGDANDILNGGAGDDWLYSGDGQEDYLSGGAGSDGVSYVYSEGSVRIVLGVSAEGNGAWGDVIRDDVENLRGSMYDDTLDGNTKANILIGGGGFDVLRGAAGDDMLTGMDGADTLDGGAGIDTVAYGDGGTVAVDLSTGRGSGGNALGDTYYGIENVSGSPAGDTLVGNAGANVLLGWNGNDVLRGGAGLDRLDGGAGTDTASYYSGTTGVLVSLASGLGSGGEAQGDILSGVENLSGSQGHDSLYGNAGANVLQGWNGNDSLIGRAGKDTLTGGAGADRFSFTARGDSVVGASADQITDFSRAQGDKIDLSLIDANTSASGNQAFTFIGNSLYTYKAGELRFAIGDGRTTIAGDVDGNGTSDFHIVLTGAVPPAAGDFAL
jgi:Ca2+-binding RTX toxin-like protein